MYNVVFVDDISLVSLSDDDKTRPAHAHGRVICDLEHKYTANYITIVFILSKNITFKEHAFKKSDELIVLL